ncbi:hypothetical protein [Bacillus sp. 1P06AnD]|uniref:hypothetical protein n=1 Tax=Bacillus sp. 1P06AnD TaxID=3132208 RepID=UPI0039A25822
MSLTAIFVIMSIFIAGCSNSSDKEEQYINVQKRIGNEYEDFNDITNKDEVQKVKDILHKSEWEHRKVDMARPADYRFIFQYKNPGIAAKAIVYELWIIPNKDQVELVRGDSEYIQLDKKRSAELVEIITGNKISDLN